jgi:hypothetical protein
MEQLYSLCISVFMHKVCLYDICPLPLTRPNIWNIPFEAFGVFAIADNTNEITDYDFDVCVFFSLMLEMGILHAAYRPSAGRCGWEMLHSFFFSHVHTPSNRVCNGRIILLLIFTDNLFQVINRYSSRCQCGSRKKLPSISLKCCYISLVLWGH